MTVPFLKKNQSIQTSLNLRLICGLHTAAELWLLKIMLEYNDLQLCPLFKCTWYHIFTTTLSFNLIKTFYHGKRSEKNLILLRDNLASTEII